MDLPRVGLMTFGDDRTHEWENYFRGLTVPRHRKAIEYFESLPIELHALDEVARPKEQIDRQVDALMAAGAESFIAHIPCWTSPNLVMRGVQRMDVPTVLVSNKEPGTHGSVGLFGAAGALDQIGKPHLRVREDFDGPQAGDIQRRTLPLFRAASAVARLRGKVFGLYGGRSLGIDTGTFDPMQWRRQFQVDAEHIDQLEIIRRAELVSDEKVEQMLSWLADNVHSIAYNDQGLTPAKLEHQVRCYLATKEINAEKGLDFVGVKCHPELSGHYVPQCITAAFMPGPYDAEGEKEPTMMACEADADAALTMELLKSVSGGKSVLFMDVSYIDDETLTFYLPNCGALSTWYAGRSDDPAANLRKVEVRPAMRAGGGAITYFTCAPGPLTLARLYRKAGQYQMAIMTGDVIDLSQDKYERFVDARGKHQLPTVFVEAAVNLETFTREFASNHILGVAGTYVDELVHVCRLLDIPAVFMNREEERP